MISVEHLTKRYGPTVAVSDVSFEVRQGEILGFLGPNGAGKTTTMRVITGYLPPSEGQVNVAGFDVTDAPLEAQSELKPPRTRRGSAPGHAETKSGAHNPNSRIVRAVLTNTRTGS